ncbi:E3 ubiquitin-protein ligase MARCHF2-like [Athalia rosae]|uniref:E3 ubiquitin-protein ligase MARCHF2-like n=1 Tax=Athalia rosae TaxID=37344 RepID=UPI002033F65F|nr:E3 ubiquitin-protein ligase MARCHF2-like [Athalia rosae]XP_048512007.1 E3 ubiquitin-protein ligase MARCHF2-like [Athalia rosae]XP_048512011.1 E3 ubiquitin-protein ligase MARCHF2-like [Athalia rosae]XP_048512021.1 E3 ubiquitin-protein ligase MARCHF2-like [Athalia rosae]XP_048512024.1 E3 ubiquitin-protein ligase MARCHF2-like [Athalia rosae]
MSNVGEEIDENETITLREDGERDAPPSSNTHLSGGREDSLRLERRNISSAKSQNHDFPWTATDAPRDLENSSKMQSRKYLNKSRERKQEEDDISSGSSFGDICRICHMGGFPPLSDPQPMWEWQSQTVRRVSSEISTLSSYAHLGPLISACKCRGSVALVHAECLERWLTESGHSRCELCGHKYATKRVPRHGIIASVKIWFDTVIATRQMILDTLYLLVTTPLALFSCYVCALALRVLLESGFYEIPWTIIAMLPTCTLTLIAYWGWLITLGRLHSRRWRRFWRNNFVVRLLPDNALEQPERSNNATGFSPSLAGPSPISNVVNLLDNGTLNSARENRDPYPREPDAGASENRAI